jgi:hypothetical protein
VSERISALEIRDRETHVHTPETKALKKEMFGRGRGAYAISAFVSGQLFLDMSMPCVEHCRQARRNVERRYDKRFGGLSRTSR